MERLLTTFQNNIVDQITTGRNNLNGVYIADMPSLDPRPIPNSGAILTLNYSVNSLENPLSTNLSHIDDKPYSCSTLVYVPETGTPTVGGYNHYYIHEVCNSELLFDALFDFIILTETKANTISGSISEILED